MSGCRRVLGDRETVHVRNAHDTPLDGHDPHCRGCLPCPVPAYRHCSVRSCTRHLDAGELGTCDECRGQTRRDLASVFDLAALLPGHALFGGHDARLVAAAPLPGGDALVMLSRGSEGLSDDSGTAQADEQLPPSFVLAWWEEQWRVSLDLDSKPTPWRRRPARALVQAHAFLDEHLGWAASHHPGFGAFAADVRRLRGHLEEILSAGDAAAEGVPCFNCDTTLVREYRDPRVCRHTTPAREWIRTLAGYGLPAWPTEVREARRPCGACDQGGLDSARASAGWYCPRCRHHYSVGEYDLAVRTDYAEVAPQLPATELAERLGVQPATIWQWAHRGHVKRRGRGADRRTLYDVADATRQARKERTEGA